MIALLCPGRVRPAPVNLENDFPPLPGAAKLACPPPPTGGANAAASTATCCSYVDASRPAAHRKTVGSPAGTAHASYTLTCVDAPHAPPEGRHHSRSAIPLRNTRGAASSAVEAASHTPARSSPKTVHSLS